MNLRIVDTHSREDINTLFKLLAERTGEQAISHKKMPTFGEHTRFVKSCPYQVWYLITDGGEPVGATYLTHANELGIFVFNRHKGKGYGKGAILEMLRRFEPPFYANINPANEASRKFFESLGFKFIQTTYAYGGDDA